MTRPSAPGTLLTSRFGAVALATAFLGVAGCQDFNPGRLLQVESPQSRPALETPPSHQRPPVTGPRTSRANVPPGTNAATGQPISPGAQVVQQSVPPRANAVVPQQNVTTQPYPGQPQPGQPGAQPYPNPDLPSLSYLLNRAPQPAQADAQRPIVPPPATTDTVRVGLLLPLSGANAAIGKALLDAAQLAMFDFADRKLELLPVDTHGTPQGAAAAAQTAIGDGAQIILGPLLASSVRAVAPATRAAHVAVLAFSSDRRVAGAGVYTMGFLPEDQVRRVVGYAIRRGITRFAALAPDNAYGATVFETIREAVRAGGATMVAAQFYDPGAEDFTAVVRTLADYDNRRQALVQQRKELERQNDEVSRQALKRLENLQTIGDLPFDALLIADGGKRLLSVAALLPFYDVDPSKVRMLGTGQWDVPEIGAEPALLGGWYAAPDPAARQGFVKQYQDTYGVAPLRLATLAYDATALAAVIARAQTGPDFSEATLGAKSGFDGRDGIFRFGPNGAAERGLAVMQVGRHAPKVLERAPTTFQAAIN
ncbi:MAG: penicillin-binding protein activator [Rhodospirillaceae bacterium]